METAVIKVFIYHIFESLDTVQLKRNYVLQLADTNLFIGYLTIYKRQWNRSVNPRSRLTFFDKNPYRIKKDFYDGKIKTGLRGLSRRTCVA